MTQLELFRDDEGLHSKARPAGNLDLVPTQVRQPASVRELLHAWKGEFLAWCGTLFSAGLYATVIVTFVFQVARVEGSSMAPTLEDQDRLVVDKITYQLSDPQPGDIVMLFYPVNPDLSFVKRVIARERDTVRIEGGHVYVNEIPFPEDFVAPEFRLDENFGPVQVPVGYYFVMGDHRNNSSDSRHWNFVPKKYIVGKVRFRWWPIPKARTF